MNCIICTLVPICPEFYQKIIYRGYRGREFIFVNYKYQQQKFYLKYIISYIYVHANIYHLISCS